VTTNYQDNAEGRAMITTDRYNWTTTRSDRCDCCDGLLPGDGRTFTAYRLRDDHNGAVICGECMEWNAGEGIRKGRTYLGWSLRKAVAVGLAAAAVGAAIGFALPTPDVAPCGFVTEEGAPVPASCTDADELDATLAAIRETRTGGRFDAGYAECAAMLAADDWDAGTCWTEWDDLETVARTIWGPDGDPETGADK